MDVGGWLRNLGLEQYEAAFRDNAINEKVLPSLTAEGLEGFGRRPGRAPPRASRRDRRSAGRPGLESARNPIGIDACGRVYGACT